MMLSCNCEMHVNRVPSPLNTLGHAVPKKISERVYLCIFRFLFAITLDI